MDTVSSFQTQRELRDLLEGAGLRPQKRFGQHFLVDRNLMQKLIDAAELGPTDAAIEVGVGTASLTTQLAERAAKVIAVEIDERIAEIARGRLEGHANVQLIVGDVLQTKSKLSPEFVTALHDATSHGLHLKLVANLPYDIATPLIMNLLVADIPIERMCFTVQKEVGDRFLATCGDDAYGIVSILTALRTTPRRIAAVPREAFWPRPKVESAMLCLEPHDANLNRAPDSAAFATFLKTFFQQRRKTVGRISAESPETQSALASAQIERSRRPEAISPDDWLRTWQALHERPRTSTGPKPSTPPR